MAYRVYLHPVRQYRRAPPPRWRQCASTCTNTKQAPHPATGGRLHVRRRALNKRRTYRGFAFDDNTSDSVRGLPRPSDTKSVNVSETGCKCRRGPLHRNIQPGSCNQPRKREADRSRIVRRRSRPVRQASRYWRSHAGPSCNAPRYVRSRRHQRTSPQRGAHRYSAIAPPCRGTHPAARLAARVRLFPIELLGLESG